MLGNLIYIHFTPQHITVRNITAGTEVTDEPLVALQDKRVLAVGKAARLAEAELLKQGQPVQLINPFDDGRVVLRDFEVADSLIKYMVRLALPKRSFIAPIILIQFRGALTTPLSPIESRALSELALAAGARKAFVLVENQRFTDAELLNPNMLKNLK